MRYLHPVPIIAAILLLTAQHALPSGLAPLSGSKLHEQCLMYVSSAHSTSGQSCASYVQGFLEGSPLILLGTSEKTDTRHESFSERALRTRLGISSRVRPLYCVDQTVSLSQFIAKLLTYIDEHSSERDASASAMLYGALQRFYRCNK